MWTVGLIIPAPVAKSLTIKLREEPTSSQLDDLMHREGAISASVTPPPKGD
jgi:hypothetical protein